MTEQHKQDAPAYDDRGNVRPTDARFTGGKRPQLSNQELAAIREQEIADGWAKVAEQTKAEQEANDKRLADAQAAVSPAPATAPVDATDPDADAVVIQDRYTDLDIRALQAEAKGRDGVSAGGSAEDLRARLRADDEASA